jgi:predicted methyltransferase
MKRISLLETAHEVVIRHLSAGDFAVDATVGNGHDTVFLAGCVGENGQVFGFDIQAQAVETTRQRLQVHECLPQVSLFHGSHALMAEFLPKHLLGQIAVVMFNLGYLPGGDKTVITDTNTTLLALDAAYGLLAEGGVITVLAYPGHAGGDRELVAVEAWCQRQEAAQQMRVEVFNSSHHQPTAPLLLVLYKLSASG